MKFIAGNIIEVDYALPRENMIETAWRCIKTAEILALLDIQGSSQRTDKVRFQTMIFDFGHGLGPSEASRLVIEQGWDIPQPEHFYAFCRTISKGEHEYPIFSLGCLLGKDRPGQGRAPAHLLIDKNDYFKTRKEKWDNREIDLRWWIDDCCDCHFLAIKPL